MARQKLEATDGLEVPAAARPGGEAPPRARRGWPVAAGVGLAGFVALAVAVATGFWLGGWDAAALTDVVASRQTLLTPAAQLLTWLGSGPVLAGVGLAAAATLWLRSRRALLPAAMLSTLACSAGLVTLIKIVTARPRPPASLVIGAPAGSDAFPSGHTTNGSVVYILAALLLALTVTRPAVRRAALAAALVVALLIGWSRLYLGFHWFSDVVAGWLLAAAIVCAAMTVVARWPVPPRRPPVDPTQEQPSLARSPGTADSSSASTVDSVPCHQDTPRSQSN